MSAFMHTTTHIDAIIHGVRALTDPRMITFGNPSQNLADNPTAAGQLLLRANAHSVAYLYHNGATRSAEVLDYLHTADTYEYDRATIRPSRTPEEILMAIASYEYQSCERPDWRNSDAFSLIYQMQRALLHALPGYATADTWILT